MFMPNKHRYTIVHFPYGRGSPDPLPDTKKPHPPPPPQKSPQCVLWHKILIRKVRVRKAIEFGNPYYILLKCDPKDVIACTLYLFT